MFRRLFWLAVGLGLGFGLSFWLMRFVRNLVERYSPERVSGNLADAVRQLGTDLRAAVEEGREGMREAEAALRAELAGQRSRA